MVRGGKSHADERRFFPSPDRRSFGSASERNLLTMSTHILGDLTAFLDAIFTDLAKQGVDVSCYELDHLCYRVATPALYEAKKREIEVQAHLLSEAQINGRPIATYELHQPVIYKGRRIAIVEIPYPKPGKTIETGLEHVEFVIHEPFESFLKLYPHLPFGLEGMKKAHNPEIELNLTVGNVKFHHTSLKDAIAREQA